MRRLFRHLSLVALLCLGSIACELEENVDHGEIGDGPPLPNEGQPSCDDIQLSADESTLYEELMQARKHEGLPHIPLSASLTLVAQVHADDADANPDLFNASCNLHSWNTSSDWSGCCYTSDHAEKECMWDKPYEISNFPSAGYEIAYRGQGTPEQIVDAWLGSEGHRDVLLNRAGWADFPFESIGVGISEEREGQRFAFVWFAVAPDCH